MTATTDGSAVKVPIPFSHHSHSGQFCGHATNTLTECVESAIAKGMHTFCLTEHMYRDRVDFYPEEEHDHTPETLRQLYDDFYTEGRRLQHAYADRIRLLVGFEAEWIRESTPELVHGLLEKYPVDLFVGSVHHVHTVPIDYDATLYHKARDVAGGSDERIFADYFDAQFDMLKTFRPPVIGHFDLIRLQSDDPDRSFKIWPGVWQRLERNLKFAREYGGVLELNSSALRKGMSEAYPQVEICRAFLAMGGRFTVSDDSHGVEQVGLNYDKVVECIVKAGITHLHFLSQTAAAAEAFDQRFPTVRWETIDVASLVEISAQG